MSKQRIGIQTLMSNGQTRIWTTLDGKEIPVNELTDSHLQNIIYMLENNKRYSILETFRLYEEQLDRKLKKLTVRLEDSDQLALWLTDRNPKIREYAEKYL